MNIEDVDWNNISKYKKILNLPEEVWLTMVEVPKHEISNYGRIRSSRSKEPIIRAISDNGNGYKILVESSREGCKTFYYHRLVAKYFLENPNNLPQVNHKPEGFGKHDNRACVLEWCTERDNILDAHANGQMDYRTKVKTSIDIKDDEFIEKMYRRYKETGAVGETAREFGVPRTTLSSIVNKRSRVYITDRIDEEFKLIH